MKSRQGARAEIYSLYRDPQTRQIRMRGRVPTDTLPPNLLITDATTSPEILAAVFPRYKQELVEIPVRRNARITQTKEPVFSQNWLLKENHLPEVVEWIKQLAGRYNNLVVITPTAVVVKSLRWRNPRRSFGNRLALLGYSGPNLRHRPDHRRI